MASNNKMVGEWWFGNYLDGCRNSVELLSWHLPAGLKKKDGWLHNNRCHGRNSNLTLPNASLKPYQQSCHLIMLIFWCDRRSFLYLHKSNLQVIWTKYVQRQYWLHTVTSVTSRQCCMRNHWTSKLCKLYTVIRIQFAVDSSLQR
jgi:hypothetical protein